MNIILITPAPPRSRVGNRATATRWARILEQLGHHVYIDTDYHGEQADLMIALHAWRSAHAIEQFATRHPRKPLIVAITGTDAYRFLHSDPETTLKSLHHADQLVGLHDLIANSLPADQHHKMNVIRQSALPITRHDPYRRYFHIAVLGHLREEKDPLRPALAARLLPASSRIHIHHYGKAYNEDWAQAATEEMSVNSRYTWHGEVAHHRVRQVYQRSNLLVLPSRMEGGANVISEAVVAGLPVVASNIEGSIGLLGAEYAGYYPVEDEHALCELLLRAEQDKEFYRELEAHCLVLQAKFTPQSEQEAWRQLLVKMGLQE